MAQASTAQCKREPVARKSTSHREMRGATSFPANRAPHEGNFQQLTPRKWRSRNFLIKNLKIIVLKMFRELKWTQINNWTKPENNTRTKWEVQQRERKHTKRTKQILELVFAHSQRGLSWADNICVKGPGAVSNLLSFSNTSEIFLPIPFVNKDVHLRAIWLRWGSIICGSCLRLSNCSRNICWVSSVHQALC